MLACWMRYEVLVVDEMAYVTMPETAGELLFQVIAGRAERAAMIVTTNLRFSEWMTMFPNVRLCKAMIDRLTDQVHIIETGTESYRFRRTLTRQRRAKGDYTQTLHTNERDDYGEPTTLWCLPGWAKSDDRSGPI